MTTSLSLTKMFIREPDSSLRHKVYHKPTRTKLFLDPNSHHHSWSKHAALVLPVHRVRALCDQDRI
jgi:hypothetical protein